MSQQQPLTWLEAQLLGNGGAQLQQAGVSLPRRGKANFTNATLADNPGTDSTDITIIVSGNLYTLDASSAAVAAGKPVCVLPTGTNHLAITKAVNSALRAAGASLGLLLANHNPGDLNVQVAIDGSPIPESMTGLGASPDGLAHDVLIDTNGDLQWCLVPTGAEFILGHADPTGKLTIAQRAANVTSPMHVYQPRTYGCPCDGVHDDLPGFQAMLADISPVGANVAGALAVAVQGTMYFSDDLHLTRPITFVGRGGGKFHTTSRLLFAPGKGLFCDHVNVSPDGGRFDLGTVGELEIESTQLINGIAVGGDNLTSMVAVRTANTFCEKGNAFLEPTGVNPAVFFRATVGGTTSSGGSGTITFTGARTYATAIPGDTATDGTCTIVCEAFPQCSAAGGNVNGWLPLHAYALGSRLFIRGDNRYYFEVTTAGTSGASIPVDMAEPSLRESIADGSVVWVVKTHAGIVVTCQAEFGKLWMSGFTGAGLHVQAGAGEIGSTAADFVRMHRLYAQYCGLGAYLGGSDVNGCKIDSVLTIKMGVMRQVRDANVGAGGFTIWNHGFDNFFSNCYAQNGAGPAFYENYSSSEPGGTGVSSTSAVYVSCRSENSYGDILDPSSIQIGLGATDYNPNHLGMILHPSSGKGLAETIKYVGASPVPVQIKVGLTEHVSSVGEAHWLTSLDERGFAALFATRYQYANDNGEHSGTGIYVRGYGTINGSHFDGFLGLAAKSSGPNAGGPGVGLTVKWKGDLRPSGSNGVDLTTPYDGDISMLRSKRLRGGYRIVGDTFIDFTVGAAGAWRGQTITTAGYRGTTWAPGAYTAGAPVFGIEADVVEPTSTANDNVFAVIGGGTATVTEPTWSSAPSVGNTVTQDGVTYTNIGTRAKSALTRFVDDAAIAYEPRAHSRVGAGSGATVTTCVVDSTRNHKQTTDATANQIVETYTVPANTAECVDYVIVAKLQGGLGSAAWKVTVGVERNGSGAAALQYTPTPSLLWATNGLAPLTAASVSVAVSATTGAIDFRATGIAATVIDWEVIRQSLEAT